MRHKSKTGTRALRAGNSDSAALGQQAGSLGLDSIDSIEMVVMMEREYGLKIENPKDGRDILQTINSMMDFIEKGRAAKAAEEKA